MGVYTRPNSPYWHYFNERTKERIKTEIRIGLTTQQRKDSKQLASDVYHKVMNQQAARIHKLPLEHAALRFSKYAAMYRPTILTHKGNARELELLAQLVAFFGTDGETSGGNGQPKDDLLVGIDRERVVEYYNWRKATGKSSGASINREIDLLKSMLRDACPKHLDTSPLVGMKRFKTPKPRRRLMTKNEETRLLNMAKKLDRVFYALFVLALDTLTRMGDLLDLKRTHRTGDLLWIADPKNDEGYETVLSPRAEAALNAIENTTDTYYFAKFRKAENPRDWRSSVRQRLEIICREAKVNFGRAANGISFHWATRRTGATRLIVEKKKPIPAVQALGGWKKPDILLDIYNEADRTAMRDAVGRRTPKTKARA